MNLTIILKTINIDNSFKKIKFVLFSLKNDSEKYSDIFYLLIIFISKSVCAKIGKIKLKNIIKKILKILTIDINKM